MYFAKFTFFGGFDIFGVRGIVTLFVHSFPDPTLLTCFNLFESFMFLASCILSTNFENALSLF